MKRKKIILGVVVMLGVALLPISSKAVLQANPNTHGRKTANVTYWMTNIRKMETKNQAMGLEETVASNLIPTSESNGIDVHMIKTTEWGTVALLSASGYGNSKWLQNSEIKSTTGNKSGVYIPLTSEWTAGGNCYILDPYDKKYYSKYRENEKKIGDALICAKWHGAKEAYTVSANRVFFRGNGYLFDYNGGGYEGQNDFICRAAVVCGEGF